MDSITPIELTKCFSDTYVRIGSACFVDVDNDKVTLAIPKTDTNGIDLILRAIKVAFRSRQEKKQYIQFSNGNPLGGNITQKQLEYQLIYARLATSCKVQEFDGNKLKKHSRLIPVGGWGSVSFRMIRYTSGSAEGVKAVIKNVCLFQNEFGVSLAFCNGKQSAQEGKK